MTTARAVNQSPAASRPSDEFLRLVPFDFAREHLVLSEGVDQDSGIERLRVSSATGQDITHNIGVALGRPVNRFVADDDLTCPPNPGPFLVR